jgi:hypothetical protein
LAEKDVKNIWLCVVVVNILSIAVNGSVVLYKVSQGKNTYFNFTAALVAVMGCKAATHKVKKEKQKEEWLQLEQRSEELLEQCINCEYFYGQNQIICAVHPSGCKNCSDFLAIKSVE